MKQIKFIKPGFLILLMFACIGQIFCQEIPRFRIDPSQAHGGYISDYFESVEYIPLETTEESMFGEIADMIVTDSSYVILDEDRRTVYFFLKNGKFVSKVKANINTFPSISYDETGKIIYINNFDPLLEKITSKSVFTITGKKYPIATIKINMDIKNATALGNGFFMVRKSCPENPGTNLMDSTFHLIDIYYYDKIYNSFIPFNQKENPAFCSWAGGILPSVNQIGADGLFYISTPLEHKIYKVNKDSAIKIGQLEFPADRSFPDSAIFNADKKFIDSMQIAVFKDKFKILGAVNLFSKGQHLFFKLHIIPSSTGGSEAEQQYNFMYDTITKKLVSFERMRPDHLSSYLPIIDRSSRGYPSFGVLVKDDFAYSNISSAQMFSSHDSNKFRNPKYTTDLKKYFHTQSRKSNPVMVKLKWKKWGK